MTNAHANRTTYSIKHKNQIELGKHQSKQVCQILHTKRACSQCSHKKATRKKVITSKRQVTYSKQQLRMKSQINS